MRTKFALAFFVVLAAAVASAQTLTRYEYPNDGFRASFPSKPELQKQNVPTDAGTFESLLRAGNLVAQSRQQSQATSRLLEKVDG